MPYNAQGQWVAEDTKVIGRPVMSRDYNSSPPSPWMPVTTPNQGGSPSTNSPGSSNYAGGQQSGGGMANQPPSTSYTGPTGGVGTPGQSVNPTGAYVPPSGFNAGNQGLNKWLEQVNSYTPIDLTQEGTNGASNGGRYTAQDALTEMLQRSNASKYLNPFYLQQLKDSADQLQAMYTAQGVTGPNHQGAPVQSGTGTPMSMGQFLQNLVNQRAGSGQLGSLTGNFGERQSRNQNVMNELRRQQGLPVGDAGRQAFERLGSDPGRMQNLFQESIQGPFASFYRDPIAGEFATQRAHPEQDINALWNRVMGFAQQAGYGVQ